MKVTNKFFILVSVMITLAIASAQPASAAAGQRTFYVTKDGYTGSEALSACAKGYHMASIFEILNVSNLRYIKDKGFGFISQDSGEGPPAEVAGWVRTGGSKSGAGSAGTGNCEAWTSDSTGDVGTAAGLPSQWEAPAVAISPWIAVPINCSSPTQVWCVQD
jgi:hypothetical protein